MAPTNQQHLSRQGHQQSQQTQGTTGLCGDVVRYMLNSVSQSSPSANQDRFFAESYCNELNVFLDFEHCLPNDSEREVYTLFERILDEASRVEVDLADYGVGASSVIKESHQFPDDEEVQKHAAEVVEKFAVRTKRYHDLAHRMEQALPLLLWPLCSGPLSPVDQIDASQALAKQWAHVVDFVFRLDTLKMNTPALQNDFSFYRRITHRSREAPAVPHEDANTISLFLASPTPMLNTLSSATVKFVRDHPHLPVANTTDTLIAIIVICRQMLEREEFVERLTPELRDFFLRVMIGSLILFDHVDTDGGAFSRRSPIDLQAVVAAIRKHTRDVEPLLNALRYTTKHFNDSDVPKSIRSLFN